MTATVTTRMTKAEWKQLVDLHGGQRTGIDERLAEVGFDLDQKFEANLDDKTGDLIFTQEIAEVQDGDQDTNEVAIDHYAKPHVTEIQSKETEKREKAKKKANPKKKK